MFITPRFNRVANTICEYAQAGKTVADCLPALKKIAGEDTSATTVSIKCSNVLDQFDGYEDAAYHLVERLEHCGGSFFDKNHTLKFVMKRPQAFSAGVVLMDGGVRYLDLGFFGEKSTYVSLEQVLNGLITFPEKLVIKMRDVGDGTLEEMENNDMDDDDEDDEYDDGYRDPE